MAESDAASTRVSSWDTPRVLEWLDSVSLGHLKDKFAAITGKDLLHPETLVAKTGLEPDAAGALRGKLDSLIASEGAAATAPSIEDFVCQICMDIWVHPVTVTCGHTFCRACLTNWLIKNPTCPSDRRELPHALPSVNIALAAVIQRLFPAEIAARLARVSPAERAAEEDAARRAAEAQRVRDEAAVREKAEKVARLKNHFRVAGLTFDDAAMEAVLDVCDGNVANAITFLELQGDAPANFVDVRNVGSGNTAPPDYMRLPPAHAFPPIPAAPPAHALQGLLDCFVTADTPLARHVEIQRTQHDVYVGVLRLCLQRGIDIMPSTKARILAAAWARRDYPLAERLLGADGRGLIDLHEGQSDLFGLVEVVKALKLLDAARCVRVLQRKRDRLVAQQARASTLRQIDTEIAEHQRDAAAGCSLSGALAKHVRELITRIPASKLEFFALQLTGDPWRELADLVHLHPTTGTALPWFLPRIYGVDAPPESIVTQCANMNEDNVAELIERHHPPFSFVRQRVPRLTAECRALIARYTPVDQCIWWYEDLTCDAFDKILLDRMKAGEKPTLSYGKLMERLMLLRNAPTPVGRELFTYLLGIAETRLQGMRLALPPPVVVLGDASYSMDVAIRVSVIMASILTVLTHAELRFFNSVSYSLPTVPTTAAQVLEAAATTRADGTTAPAAALMEYYRERRPVSTFVVVTDERENAKAFDTYFPELFRRYVAEVHPARLVLISFLEMNTEGQMATALRALGITPIQFVLESRRPDLTKLDGLLAILSTHTPAFQQDAVEAAAAATAVPMEGVAQPAAAAAGAAGVGGSVGAAAAAGPAV